MLVRVPLLQGTDVWRVDFKSRESSPCCLVMYRVKYLCEVYRSDPQLTPHSLLFCSSTVYVTEWYKVWNSRRLLMVGGVSSVKLAEKSCAKKCSQNFVQRGQCACWTVISRSSRISIFFEKNFYRHFSPRFWGHAFLSDDFFQNFLSRSPLSRRHFL